MAEQLAEIDRIAKDPAPPTFENTIAALERRRPRRSTRVLSDLRRLELDAERRRRSRRSSARWRPKLAAFRDEITQNETLFARIAAVYDGRETAGLTPEQQRLAWLDYTTFVRAGAKLDAAGEEAARRDQPAAGDALHDLQPERARRRGGLRALSSTSEADLAGLPDSVRAGGRGRRRGARAEGQVGDHQHALVDRAVPHLLRRAATCARRSGGPSSAAATTATRTTTTRSITEILQLRAERAKLLGYPTHAHWRLEDTMAKTPERAMALMEAVWTPAVARVHEEVADMQAIADKEGGERSRSRRGTTATTRRRCARRSTTSTRTR